MARSKEHRSKRPTRWIGMLGSPTPPAPAQSRRFFFVHCAAEDFDRIAPLIQSAEADGHLFWVPQRHPRSPAEIAAAAEASAALVVFYSEAMPVRDDLLAAAAGSRKPILPVWLTGGEIPDALLYHVSAHHVIDAHDPDWRLKFKRALRRLAPLRSATVVPLRPTAATPPAPPAVRRIAAPRRRMSYAQSFINAFAAGAMALFAFAMMELTGGPPTPQEIQDVAVGVHDVAEDAVEAGPI